LVTAFLATAARVAAFVTGAFATAFLAAAVRVTVFLAGAFATVFLAGAARVTVFLAGAFVTAFLAGAFATDFLAGVLAGVLVAVRFTGFEAAGLTLVAATYTLSVCWPSTGHGRASPKASVMGNIGAISLWILRCPVSGRQ
jgi:hypothetical protein